MEANYPIRAAVEDFEGGDVLASVVTPPISLIASYSVEASQDIQIQKQNDTSTYKMAGWNQIDQKAARASTHVSDDHASLFQNIESDGSKT